MNWKNKKPVVESQDMISDDGNWSLRFCPAKSIKYSITPQDILLYVSGNGTTVELAGQNLIVDVDRAIAQLQKIRDNAVLNWGDPALERKNA